MENTIIGLLYLFSVVVVLLAYCAPTIIAFHRKHHYRWIICAVNIITGASGIGYLLALVWSLWPSRTGLADVFLNDPTSNSVEAGQTIYSRYGANLRAYRREEKSSDIFVLRGGQPVGPYTVPELRAMLSSRELLPSDLCWYEGAADWMPVSAMSQIIGGFLPSPR